MTTPLDAADAAALARAFSAFINSGYPATLDTEAHGWRRVTKVVSEGAEAYDAWAAYVGENFRKPRGPLEDVLKELSDCVFAALGAIEHLTGHEGRSLDIATERARYVCRRAGLESA